MHKKLKLEQRLLVMQNVRKSLTNINRRESFVLLRTREEWWIRGGFRKAGKRN